LVRTIQEVDLLRSAQLRCQISKSEVEDEHKRHIRMLAMSLFTGEIATGKLHVKALPFQSLEGGCGVIGWLKSAEERE
jgi:hypothetical protein